MTAKVKHHHIRVTGTDEKRTHYCVKHHYQLIDLMCYLQDTTPILHAHIALIKSSPSPEGNCKGMEVYPK